MNPPKVLWTGSIGGEIEAGFELGRVVCGTSNGHAA